MNVHPAGPRPPSDPRLNEAVPVQGDLDAEADAKAQVEADVEAEILLRPFTGGRAADYLPLEQQAALAEVGTAIDATSIDAATFGDLPVNIEAADLVGRGDDAGNSPSGAGAPDLMVPRRGAKREPTNEVTAPGVSTPEISTPEISTPEISAVLRTPVTTLDVDLDPGKGNEPMRRFAIVVAALFLVVGVVLFREWGNRTSSDTASSVEATAETTIQALAATNAPSSPSTTPSTTTPLSPSTTIPSTAPSATDSEEATATTHGLDPNAARGLLEPEKITLTGAVQSQREADALVAQLENMIGIGNVDHELLSIDVAMAPLEQLILSVPDELGFKLGSDTIESSMFPVLDSLIGLCQLMPSVVIAVEGHTDSSGLENENLALSQRRAESVVNYIVDSGVNSFRLEPQGRGSTEPIADNATSAGRSQNRRIEFIVFGLEL